MITAKRDDGFTMSGSKANNGDVVDFSPFAE